MKTLWPDASSLDSKASDHQREVWEKATRGPIAILGGAGGCGKTQVAAWAIKEIVKQHGSHQVAVCGPTGKSAVRMTEMLLDNGVDVKATTIHRLLSPDKCGIGDGDWRFAYNEINQLPYKFILLDESSMASCDILSKLLGACRKGTHVIMLGDFGQLPPVNHGKPLLDMIDAGIPYGELTEIWRNSGDVTKACADIRAGRVAKPSDYVDIDKGKNWRHIECPRPSYYYTTLSHFFHELPSGIDPLWDVQVLCTVNDSSDVSRNKINELLQEQLNKHGERSNKLKFRLGDKVINRENCMMPVTWCPRCLKNNLESTCQPSKHFKNQYECTKCGYFCRATDFTKDDVANGEIGKVIYLTDNLVLVELDVPYRVAVFNGDMLKELELAYVVTKHLAQGSEWPYVVSMIDDSFAADRIDCRESHYTGLSRMQKLVTTIGKKSAFDKQCLRSALLNRKTFLKNKIIDGLKNA